MGDVPGPGPSPGSVPFTGGPSCRASISDDKLWGMSLGLDPPLGSVPFTCRLSCRDLQPWGKFSVIVGRNSVSCHSMAILTFSLLALVARRELLCSQNKLYMGRFKPGGRIIEDLSKAFPLRGRSPRSGG